MNPMDVPGLPPGVPEFLVDSGIESLYPPQAAAVDAGVTDGESLVASVPTASGKTLVAELAMLSSVHRGGTALYVVPLRALASEKKAEFERWGDFDVDVGISTGNYESSEEWLSSRDIVVATSEKVDSLVRNGAPWIDDLTCVVADEVHLVDDPSRGPTLEVTLAKLRRINPDLQVVALSATVDNADEVADWLDAALVKSDWRPVDLRTGVHYGDAITFDDDSRREVPVGRGERPTAALVDDVLTQLSDGVIPNLVDSTEGLVAEVLTIDENLDQDIRREIRHSALAGIRDEIRSAQNELVVAQLRSSEGIEETARRLADSAAQRLTKSERETLERAALELRELETKSAHSLAAVVEKGAAYDHDGLDDEERRKIRSLVQEGLIKCICVLPQHSEDIIDGVEGRDIRGVKGGAALVFVNSRRNAEAAARRQADVTERHLTDDERDELAALADEVASVSDTETSDDLAAVVRKGAAFHHAGLAAEHRSLVEDAFRDRLLKVIGATPTLAAGVNTPSRRVIVRDWRRYDGEFGGMKPLDVLEVHQMFGRAGRPGLDPYGEAVLLAKDHDTMDELFERYVHADPEPVQSKLAREPAMRTHLLATIASGFARTREGLRDFLDRTLYATQSGDTDRLESVVDSTLEYLVANDFVERDGDEITASGLGHTVSRLYLDPMSAAEIVDGLRAADDPTPLGLYHLVCRTPDMYELYLKSGDRETYTELCYERETEFLGRVPSEFEDVRFEEWLSALKTAKLLEDWTREVDEDRLTDRYGVGPGDIRGKVDTAEWLLGAAERLAVELELGCVVAVREAKKRVQYGVREELLDLAGVRNVGRKRARRLYEAGVETRADLREADKATVLGALRGRERTAERILENAGRRDPSMDGVETDDDDGATTGADDAERAGATGGQASLGDFE